jgi:hypothetical protein
MPVVRNHAELDRFKQDKIISLFNKVDFLTQQFENAKVTQEENEVRVIIKKDITEELLNPEVRPYVDKLSQELRRV